jgi:hypothetical protein
LSDYAVSPLGMRGAVLGQLFPIPRDGGIGDLLAEAGQPKRAAMSTGAATGSAPTTGIVYNSHGDTTDWTAGRAISPARCAPTRRSVSR